MTIQVNQKTASVEILAFKPNAPKEVIDFKCAVFNECPELVAAALAKYYEDGWRLICIKEIKSISTFEATRYFFEREKPSLL